MNDAAASSSCATEVSGLDYVATLMARLIRRFGAVAIAMVLVLVPTLARAHQRVDHRDETRLSIKQSWIGVSSPTKSIDDVPRRIVGPAVIVVDGPRVMRRHAPNVVEPAVHPLFDLSPDPRRGPPALL